MFPCKIKPWQNMADDRNYLSSSSLYHLPLITCLTGKYCQDIGWAYKLLGKPQSVLFLAIFILCLVALFNILEKICCSVRFLVSSCILMIKQSIVSNLKTVFALKLNFLPEILYLRQNFFPDLKSCICAIQIY